MEFSQLTIGIGSRCIKVPQRDVFNSMRNFNVLQHTFDNKLGISVRIYWLLGIILLKWQLCRYAINRTTTRKYDILAVKLRTSREQVGGSINIGVKIFCWLLNGLSDIGICGKMDHCPRSPFSENSLRSFSLRMSPCSRGPHLTAHRWPRSRLSNVTGVHPARARALHVWLPTKPAPPVTSIVFMTRLPSAFKLFFTVFETVMNCEHLHNRDGVPPHLRADANYFQQSDYFRPCPNNSLKQSCALKKVMFNFRVGLFARLPEKSKDQQPP